jgi:hypothetical protein
MSAGLSLLSSDVARTAESYIRVAASAEGTVGGSRALRDE